MKSPLEKLIFRDKDLTGNGWYGAKRGRKKHKAVDIIGTPGEDVFAPICGLVTKIGQVYAQTTRFKYVEITNDVYRIRLMYCKPSVKLNQLVVECDVIGVLQDVASYWNPEMKPHLHIQLWKHGLLTDPEPLLKLSD